MAGNAVGLDIGTSGVRAAELTVGKGSATLHRFGQVALPVGAVRDGEVVDVAAVSEAIKHLWATAKFSTKRVILGVANQKVIVRQVDLPYMPEAELRKTLGMHVADFIPIPVDQAILDFHPLETVTSENGVRTLRVLLVAATRDMVMTALDAAKGAGLQPLQVDLTPFAVLRSLAQVDHVGTQPGMQGGAEAIVDVGATVTNIVIHQNGVPRFVRILLMGGDHVTDAVSERLGVPFEQAVAVKQQLGMSPVRGEIVSEHPAARVIEASATAFLEEIRGSLDYYLAQPASVPLQRVVLSGGGATTRRPCPAPRRRVTSPGPPRRCDGLVADREDRLDARAAQLRRTADRCPVGLALGVAS